MENKRSGISRSSSILIVFYNEGMKNASRNLYGITVFFSLALIALFCVLFDVIRDLPSDFFASESATFTAEESAAIILAMKILVWFQMFVELIGIILAFFGMQRVRPGLHKYGIHVVELILGLITFNIFPFLGGLFGIIANSKTPVAQPA